MRKQIYGEEVILSYLSYLENYQKLGSAKYMWDLFPPSPRFHTTIQNEFSCLESGGVLAQKQ